MAEFIMMSWGCPRILCAEGSHGVPLEQGAQLGTEVWCLPTCLGCSRFQTPIFDFFLFPFESLSKKQQ